MLGEQAVIVRTVNDTIMGWTAGAAELAGYREHEIVGRSARVLFPDGLDADAGRATLRARDGRLLPVLCARSPVHDASGKLIAFTDVLTSVEAGATPPQVSRRANMPSLPPQVDSAFLHVLESLPMMCWTATPEGCLRFVSSRWTEYTGVPTERLLGTGWSEVIHPDDVDRASNALYLAPQMPPGTPLTELRIRARDGTYRWFEVRAAAEYDEQGHPARWFGATLDVHEMHLARDALHREREHLERIVVAAPGAFYSCRLAPDGTLSLPHVSVALQKLLGITPEAFNAGLATLEPVHPDDRERVLESVMQSAQTLRRWELEFRMLSDRGTIWVHGSSMPTREEDGGVQWFGFLQDVTERKHMEEAQLRSQKLEAVGTLAGGIAHDFNNMLHAIAGNCALALRHLPPGHPSRALLESASVAGERAGDLVRRLLQFSRPSEPHREVVPLRGVVREALRLVRATLPARIEIHEELGAVDPYVQADATEVHQIMLNLTANAAHAIGEASGFLRVRIEQVTVDPADPRAPPGLRGGTYAALHVSDSGAGMDECTASRVFDPFFTTKRMGEGSGLGLSMVHGILASLGGGISVRSAPGEGSTFTLYFPVRAAPTPRPAPPPVEVEPPSGGRVLLVDDEPILVELGAHTLETLGFTVYPFTSPREALRAFLADPDGVDVVLTDYAMPDLSGFDLSKRILEVRPTLPIVMMSGNVSAEEIGVARKLGLHDVLLKPVGIETLGGTVRDAVRAGRARARYA